MQTSFGDMMEAQSITQTGPAISADWGLTIAISVIGFLLLALAKIATDRITDKLKEISIKLVEHDDMHDIHIEKHNELKNQVTLIETKMQSEISKSTQEIAEMIVTKLKVAGSRPSDWAK